MKILLIDDNRFDRALVIRELHKEFPEAIVTEISDSKALERALASADFDAVITDYQLQWNTGIEVLKTIKKINQELPVIMFTGTGNEIVAIEAMQAGLDDYVIKSAKHFVRLPISIRQVLEKQRLRQAEKKAAETIARLHAYRELILNAATDGIIGLDQDGRHTFVNPAARQILGYEHDELKEKDSHGLWHHSYQDGSPYPVANCPVHDSIHRQTTCYGQEYFWRKNGTGFIAEFASAPIRENDQSIGAVIVFRDITEREKAYDQLRKYEQIVAASQEHMAFIYTDYTCQAINDACLAAYRKNRDPTLGHSVAELFGTTAFEEKIKGKMAECLRGSIVRYQEWFDLPEDGRRFMDVAYYPYRDKSGTINGLVVNSRDITELKQQADALRQAEQEWAHTFDSISDFVSVHDSEYRLLKVNRSLANFLGKQPKELIGRHCYEVFHGLHHSWHDCPLGEVLKKKQPVSREVDDQAIGRPLLITVSPIFDDKGELTATVHIARDLSEAKKAELNRLSLQNQLAQAQKMECVGQLAGGVAHDFNNYLSSIIGFSDLILHSQANREEIIEMVRTIREAGERSANLVRQLLAFSRKQLLEMKTVNIDGLVQNLTKIMQRLISEDIEMEFRLQARHHTVLADPTQIEQVLMNLVVNARDAMSQGGRLSIETSVEEVDELRGRELDLLPPGLYVRLSVHDTGTGIPPEIRARIFEPFFTTKEKGKGTGLGLATVFGIIAQHNGRILCKSTVGEGSTFDVFLPVIPHLSEQADAKQAISLSRGTETILVVEDDSLSGSFLQQALSSLGYEVLLAQDGEDALQSFKTHADRVALLLTDVVLPGLSGPEIAEQIQKQSPAIKVLFISGYSDERIAFHGVLKPGINFLGKPITLLKLSAKLREILDS